MRVYTFGDADHRLSLRATQVERVLCGLLFSRRNLSFLIQWRLPVGYCACEDDRRAFLRLKQDKLAGQWQEINCNLYNYGKCQDRYPAISPTMGEEVDD